MWNRHGQAALRKCNGILRLCKPEDRKALTQCIEVLRPDRDPCAIAIPRLRLEMLSRFRVALRRDFFPEAFAATFADWFATSDPNQGCDNRFDGHPFRQGDLRMAQLYRQMGSARAACLDGKRSQRGIDRSARRYHSPR